MIHIPEVETITNQATGHGKRAICQSSRLDLIFVRKSNYMSPCLLVENVVALVVQKEAGR
jgi:hypothetical protein